MIKSHILLPVTITVFLFFAISLNLNADNKEVQEKDLTGTWQLCNPDSTVATNVGNQEGVIRYKIITSESFMVSDIKMAENALLGSFWGSYTLEKNNYSESIKFATPNWKGLVDTKNSFKLETKNDLLFIKGVDNSHDEIWKKVKE